MIYNFSAEHLQMEAARKMRMINMKKKMNAKWFYLQVVSQQMLPEVAIIWSSICELDTDWLTSQSLDCMSWKGLPSEQII